MMSKQPLSALKWKYWKNTLNNKAAEKSTTADLHAKVAITLQLHLNELHFNMT